MITVAHRIRLNPTPAQANYFMRAAGIARVAWNWCLDEYRRIKSLGQKVDWNELKKAFRSKIDAEFPYVREVTKCAAEGGVADLRRAIGTYYKAKPANPKRRFPKHRKRSKRIGGFVLNNDQFSVDGHEVNVPKLGRVNMSEPLRFKGKILNGRITEKAGRWYLTVTVEVPRPAPSSGNGSVGIDFGLSAFATFSTGEVCDTQARFRKSERRLKLLQRSLSRKVKGSNRRARQKLRIARAHERVANQRKDFLHKFSTGVVRRFGVVCVEDLNLKGLCRTRLAKSFHDASIGEAIRQLEYKADWYGGFVQKVGRFYPSSKTCHACGFINRGLTLDDRDWTCDGCGAVHHRDRNAALNIQDEGLALLAGGGSVGVTDVEFAATTQGSGLEQAADGEASRKANIRFSEQQII